MDTRLALSIPHPPEITAGPVVSLGPETPGTVRGVEGKSTAWGGGRGRARLR